MECWRQGATISHSNFFFSFIQVYMVNQPINSSSFSFIESNLYFYTYIFYERWRCDIFNCSSKITNRFRFFFIDWILFTLIMICFYADGHSFLFFFPTKNFILLESNTNKQQISSRKTCIINNIFQLKILTLEKRWRS